MHSLLKAFYAGAFTAAALACGSASAQTITINVGASPTLANSLVDLIGSFQSYYFGQAISYNIAVTVDSNENLKAAVINSTGTPPFDMLLTDDAALGEDLTVNFPSLVEGTPTTFAQDALYLYSTTVDISSGLPVDFTGPLAIADPTTDVFGRAAATSLARRPWQITTLPNERVNVQPDVSLVQAAVDLAVYPYGMVPKSAICTSPNGKKKVFADGSYYSLVKKLKGTPYEQIDVVSVRTANATRTAAQATEMTNFTNFLTGVGTTLGTDVLRRYCYALPAAPASN